MSAPLVTVVLPVYNGGQYIGPAMQSILDQHFSDFEVVVIDDGSTDDTLQTLQKFEQQDLRVRVFSRENKGLVYTLNEAIQQAKGEFVARMDADDLMTPKRLGMQVDALKSTGYDLCGSHHEVIDDMSQHLSYDKVPINPAMITLNLTFSVPFAHGAVMVRKRFLEQNKLTYGMDKRFDSIEDYVLWIKCFEARGKFTNVAEFLYKHRKNSESFSNTKKNQMNSDGLLLSAIFIKNNMRAISSAFESSIRLNLSKWDKQLLFKAFLVVMQNRMYDFPYFRILNKIGFLNTTLWLLSFVGKFIRTRISRIA